MDGLLNLQNLADAVNARQAALNSSNQVPGDTPTPQFHQRRPREDDDDEPEGDQAGAAAGAQEPCNPGEIIMFSLEAGRADKRQKTLSPASDLICEEFLKVWSASTCFFCFINVFIGLRHVSKCNSTLSTRFLDLKPR